MGFCIFDQTLLDGEEVFVHPAGAALTIAAHVVVELRAERSVRLQVGEEVEWRVVGVLVWAVVCGIGFFVACLCGVGVELEEGRVAAAGPVGHVSCIFRSCLILRLRAYKAG